jgi:hypothetical protein
MDEMRVAGEREVQYQVETGAIPTRRIVFRWEEELPESMAAEVIRLTRETSAGSPIIGFGRTIDDAEARAYLEELRANLRAGKCRLLTIFADNERLIGLCTLRRNLNPNNRHITDLAKGMIDEQFRGGPVLPAAFYEIATQCERDGVEIVTLDVRADTPAHRAWVRFGFESYGMLADYARAGGQVFAGHFMMQPVQALKRRAAAALAGQAETARAAAQAPQQYA